MSEFVGCYRTHGSHNILIKLGQRIRADATNFGCEVGRLARSCSRIATCEFTDRQRSGAHGHGRNFSSRHYGLNLYEIMRFCRPNSRQAAPSGESFITLHRNVCRSPISFSGATLHRIILRLSESPPLIDGAWVLLRFCIQKSIADAKKTYHDI